MAGSYNRIILVGNLTRDPEIRYVQSGAAVTKFTLAVNRRSKGSDETTYIDCVAWDGGSYKLAEICNTYLKKGMSALVEGRLVIRSFEDKDGNKRKATEVVIDTMQMLDSRGDAANRSSDDADYARAGGSSSRSRGAGATSARTSTSASRSDLSGSTTTTPRSRALDDDLLDQEIPF